MAENEIYKYLDMLQVKTTDENHIKFKLANNVINRVKLTITTNLWAKNVFKARNTFATPILTYSFYVTKWADTDLNAIPGK